MTEVTSPLMLDSTGQQIAAALMGDVSYNNAGSHSKYRGKGLTLNSGFWTNLDAGTFKDQFVGDTIVGTSGHSYWLAHPDYWLHTGDTECTTHHWAVVSDILVNGKMNNDNSTTGAYLGSGFRSGTNHDSTSNTALANALAIIKSDFGAAHILSKREYLDNVVTSGYVSAGTWADSEAELLSQIQAYGNRFFDPGTALGATIPALYSVDKTQLALFAQRPELLTTRSSWWLREVVSSADFALVNTSGNAANYSASNSLGVRLVFGIKA